MTNQELINQYEYTIYELATAIEDLKASYENLKTQKSFDVDVESYAYKQKVNRLAHTAKKHF